MSKQKPLTPVLFLVMCMIIKTSGGQMQEIIQIFQQCHKFSSNFNECLKGAMNQSIAFYKSGIPDLGIAPFDPHRSLYAEQRRCIGNFAGYLLVLSEINEYGWSNSKVTEFRSDPKNNQFIYTQDFPDKQLDGKYNFKAKIQNRTILSTGSFTIFLRDYVQTTTVKRVGGPGSRIKVRIEIDRIGEMKLKMSDRMADMITNNLLRSAFPLMKPLLNDLISSAFTDVFDDSFRHLNLDDFIKN